MRRMKNCPGKKEGGSGDEVADGSGAAVKPEQPAEGWCKTDAAASGTGLGARPAAAGREAGGAEAGWVFADGSGAGDGGASANGSGEDECAVADGSGAAAGWVFAVGSGEAGTSL